MICLFILMILGVPNLSFANDSDPTSLTLTRGGHFGDGTSALERFEITPDGLARWESSGMGVAHRGRCRNESGSFQGRISESQALKLTRLARDVLKTQPKIDHHRKRRSSRGVAYTLRTEVDGYLHSGQITVANEDWDELLKEITELRIALQPQALVWMKAREKKGGRLTVEFNLIGDKPLKLIFPDHPEEAFTVSEAHLKYATRLPSADGTVVLLKTKPRFVVTLALTRSEQSGATAHREIRYSNAAILHHASGDALLGDQVPPEMALCAEF